MDNLNYDQYIDRLSQVINMKLIGNPIFEDNPRLIPEDPGPQLPDGLEHPALHLPPGFLAFITAINYELYLPCKLSKRSFPQLLLRAPDDVTVGEMNQQKAISFNTALISRVYQKQTILRISRCLNGTQVTLQFWLQAWPMASWYSQTSPVFPFGKVFKPI